MSEAYISESEDEELIDAKKVEIGTIPKLEEIEENILDLDKLVNGALYQQIILTTNTIYSLVEMVKMYGVLLGTVQKDIGRFIQYCLKIKYLGHILPIVFEYDHSYQFINIIFYNKDHSKYYLKISINMSDGAIIKKIENDYSGNVPSYSDEFMKLKPGEYLVHFTHCFLTFIGFNRITLEDESYLISKDSAGNEMRTKLWLWYLITKGKSWYAKFGYEPANCSLSEYHIMLADVKSIKLDTVLQSLTNIVNAPNKHLLDQTLVENSKKIIDLIGSSSETLEQYTISHTLEEFTNLTNNLSQSVYSRKVYLQKNEDSDSEESEPKYLDIVFPWYEKYKKLLVANVIQVNNNIRKFYYVPNNNNNK